MVVAVETTNDEDNGDDSDGGSIGAAVRLRSKLLLYAKGTEGVVEKEDTDGRMTATTNKKVADDRS